MTSALACSLWSYSATSAPGFLHVKHGQCFWATASNFSGPHPSARLAGCADLVRRAFRTARSRRSRDCCLNHVRGLCCGHPSAGASGLAGETCLRSATFRFPALSRPASASMSLMLLLNPVRVSMPTLHSKAQLLQQRSQCRQKNCSGLLAVLGVRSPSFRCRR